MTRERFSDLAARMADLAGRHPRRYRWRVVAFAALGYAVLALLVAGGLGFIAAMGWWVAQPWFQEQARRHPHAWVVPGMLTFGAAAVLWSLAVTLRVRLPPPEGQPLRREEAPRLFAVLDEIIRAGRAPRVQTVLLTPDFNASVVQRPRVAILGWGSRNYLLLGVPLLAALDAAGFRAVLAHEFAHLRGGHGRLGHRVVRLRAMWEMFLLWLTAGDWGRAAGILGRFARWYGPRFTALTQALARQQEFESDAWSAALAGPEAAARALVRIALVGRRLGEEFWQPMQARARREPVVPTGAVERMAALAGASLADAAGLPRWWRAELGAVAGPGDSHPSLAERLAALGRPRRPDADALAGAEDVAPAPRPSALTLLGRGADALVEAVDLAWRLDTIPGWRTRFEESKAMRERLETLDTQARTSADGHLADVERDWEQTCLRAELAGGGPEATGAVFANFLARRPEHAQARMHLGASLLERDDPAGAAHVAEAMRLDARLASAGAELLADHLRRTGRDAEAAERRAESVRQGDRLDAAQAERQRLTPKDEFEPAGVDEAALAALRAHLAVHPRVHRAWLARKRVVHLPEHPCYVLLCTFRWRTFEFASDRKTAELWAAVLQDLPLIPASDGFLLLWPHRKRCQAIPRKVRRAAGDQPFYPPPEQLASRPRWRWWSRAGQRPPAAA